MARPIFRTALCDILDIEYPILLAGMGSRGKATPPALVAAVSEAGGMGVVGGSGLVPEELREAIRETRKLTGKPIGVDLILPAKVAGGAGATRSDVRAKLKADFPAHVAFVEALMAQHGLTAVDLDNEFVVANTTGAGGETPGSNSKNMIQQQVDVIMDEDVQMFAAGLGDPSWVVPMAREKNMTVMGLVGSPRNAVRQLDAGVDIVVAQGYEAGGHTGKIANFPLIPQVVDAVAPKPVVAAGGIADGRGVAASLSLGAVGAWVGTAFLVAEECNIDPVHKQQILDGDSRDFEISRTYTGKTARMFRNAVVEAWTDADLDPLPMPYQKILMDDFNASACAAGKLEVHSNPAGQAAGLLHESRPAAAIMRDLVTGALDALADVNGRVITA
jgi:nitronate monooxygenase